ncbi:MAG: phosphoribosylformylglycinamidine cyclo-ligase, partial [Gemmatimonadetes bacterium]|nr:phosphoribosylformylglycinamidine cyclo-ligase [Gemmatimonadota bacterium]
LGEAGEVPRDEMDRVFNMGVGMIAIAAEGDADAVRDSARRANVETWVIGEVTRGQGVTLA